MSVFPGHGRQRQEDLKFEASLDNIARPCLKRKEKRKRERKKED
jgi:hypothetical protein